MNARALLQPSMMTLALLAAGCSRPSAFPAGGAQAEAPDPGYRGPPRLRGSIKAADGAVSLSGQALPSSKVRMVSPAGARVETTADGSGAWSAAVGPVSEPTLYRLVEEEANGRRVEAEGFVAVLPGAPVVALLRAGAGAEVQDPAKVLKLLAVDYDSGGGVVVSGRARPSSPVRVLVDDQPALQGAADKDGRFSLTLPKPLSPGARKLVVEAPEATVGAEIVLTPRAMPLDMPYVAASVPFGWRIDWTTPGGGSQTTLLLGG
jgi:hypothetical protein